MIAAIVSGGRSSSFRSSLDYVLRRDVERVGQTETVNLFNAADKAHAEMEITAGAAKAIQARNRMERGERSGASGSRAEKTCFHYALSWHPDDKPSTERMFKAAHATLERLGLDEHQAVIVEHTEKLHKHLHVIVSTIHPETGRASGLYRSAYVLNRWAHEYEKGQDMIRTFKRAAVFEKLPDRSTPGGRPKLDDWKKRQQALHVDRRKDEDRIKAEHRKRREDHDARVEAVRRKADEAMALAKARHRKELNEHWNKGAPQPKAEPRPSASFLNPHVTAGEEMGKAIKALPRRIETEAPAREGIEGLKQSQKREIDEIIRAMREEIALLKADRKVELEAEAAQLAEHNERHDKLLDEARKQFRIPDKTGPEMAEETHTVESYVNDYVAGRGRDSAGHQQFAENHAQDIEKEFQRRLADLEPEISQTSAQQAETEIEIDLYGNEIIDMSGPVEPETVPYDPPPLEPDRLELDFEYGDD